MILGKLPGWCGDDCWVVFGWSIYGACILQFLVFLLTSGHLAVAEGFSPSTCAVYLTNSYQKWACRRRVVAEVCVFYKYKKCLHTIRSEMCNVGQQIQLQEQNYQQNIRR